jgi:ornithine cyclodeaminase/alanine dehydrogenase-like protein (mu-crystallin family)
MEHEAVSENQSSNELRIISAADVRRLLPMAECVDLMAVAMQAASKGEIAIPPRLITPLIDNSAFFGLMPGSTLRPRLYGAKVVSLHPSNPASGRPALQGFVTLFDHDRGCPVAIIDGAEITAIRTGAASGLATRLLANPGAKTHGVFGAGIQAVTHIEAIASVRPIEEARIWARSLQKAQALASKLNSRAGCRTRAVEDPREAAACDVVSVVTGAGEPILKGAWLQSGSHLNLVGAHSAKTREVDDEAVRRSVIYVDLRQSAMNEAGDLLLPMKAGVISPADIKGEIGQLAASEISGRQSPEQITLYKSLGVVAQDLFAAAHVYEAARQQKIGVVAYL